MYSPKVSRPKLTKFLSKKMQGKTSPPCFDQDYTTHSKLSADPSPLFPPSAQPANPPHRDLHGFGRAFFHTLTYDPFLPSAALSTLHCSFSNISQSRMRPWPQCLLMPWLHLLRWKGRRNSKPQLLMRWDVCFVGLGGEEDWVRGLVAWGWAGEGGYLLSSVYSVRIKVTLSWPLSCENMSSAMVQGYLARISYKAPPLRSHARTWGTARPRTVEVQMPRARRRKKSAARRCSVERMSRWRIISSHSSAGRLDRDP